jgi:hypothetical protein
MGKSGCDASGGGVVGSLLSPIAFKREKRLGLGCLSLDICEPAILPLRFLPRPNENDLREVRDSIEVLDSPGWVFDMLMGGYFLVSFSPCSARFFRAPKIDPLRPKILPPISPIVFDLLCPLISPDGNGRWLLLPVLLNPETSANLGGMLTLGRP